MTGSMFGPRTVRKQSEHVRLSDAQRRAAAKWLTKLNEGLAGERQNYVKFSNVILRDILGYDTTDQLDYEKGVEFLFPGRDGKGGVCFECKSDGTDLFAVQRRFKGEHSTPVKQTWDYMGTHGVEFGVCTNFRKFVLLVMRPGYGSTRWHEFDFDALAEEPDRLREFVWCFGADALANSERVDGLVDGTAGEEREITAEFYELFAEARSMLVGYLEAGGLTRMDAVRWAQTFLNRLMFVFFASDRGMVGDLSFRERMEAAATRPTSRSTKACAEILDLFDAFNAGDTVLGVRPFNGGLFADKPPDGAKFADLLPDGRPNPITDILVRMDGYDFNTEVGVNILGGIFERSIPDIEGMLGDRPTARKREGAYYTPEYVTDYLCRQSILPAISADGSHPNDVVSAVDCWGEDLDGLEARLRGLRVWDPACGSGAFLAKAVDVLLEVHRELHVRKEAAGAYDVDGGQSLDKWNAEAEAERIILGSIYGTDVSREAVQTARLSLFLRVAGGGRKLPDLSRNVVVADSVRGFDMRAVFPGVDGFDAIVGNPPYVRQEMLDGKEEMQPAGGWLGDVAVPSKSDYSVYFWLHGLNRLREGGVLGFVSPDSWMSSSYGEELRGVLAERCDVLALARPDFSVFGDAAVRTVLCTVRRGRPAGAVALVNAAAPRDLAGSGREMPQADLGRGNWNVHFEDAPPEPGVPMAKLGETGEVFRGKTTGRNSYFVLDGPTVEKYGVPAKFLAPLLSRRMHEGVVRGKDATRWLLNVRQTKSELERSQDGRRVLRYVEIGESTMITPRKGKDSNPRPISKLTSAAGRRLWYDLGLEGAPAAFLSRFIDKRFKFYENGGDMYAQDSFACYTPSDARHLHPALAWLACSWFGLYQEMHGHPAGAGALQFMIGDYRAAPVPDFAKMTPDSLKKWAAAWRAYCRDLNRDRLDGAVMPLLGLTPSEADGVRRALARMIERRRSNRGTRRA